MNPDSRYWVLDGHTPVQIEDIHEWGRRFEDQNRVVAQDIVFLQPGVRSEAQVQVSTVFLGLDHRMGGEGPPLLFETMIFNGRHDQYTQRYATWAQAEAGHAAAVKLAKRMLVEELDDHDL